jgi:hypothetical protein
MTNRLGPDESCDTCHGLRTLINRWSDGLSCMLTPGGPFVGRLVVGGDADRSHVADPRSPMSGPVMAVHSGEALACTACSPVS